MDIRKFTQRSVEAIQGAQGIAIEHNNQQVDEEHLLLALLTQEDSLIASLIKRMGKDDEARLYRCPWNLSQKAAGNHASGKDIKKAWN